MSGDLQDDRYSRQTRFAGIGEAGQARIQASTVTIVGCGALGSVAAEMLCRAGVGRLRIIDRDFVEWSNLQRQSLFTEADAEKCVPKVIAAEQHLLALNISVEIDAHIADLHAESVDGLLAESDLIIDATDNFLTRHLINEYACEHKIPWIYAACVGSYACGMTIIPGQTACFACIQDELPAVGDNPTCDSTGIIAPAVHAASARQCAEALKILAGNANACSTAFWSWDLWNGKTQAMNLGALQHEACPACGSKPTYPYRSAQQQSSISLCGRGGMQIRLERDIDLAAFAQQVKSHLERSNPYLVRWIDGALTGTCFADGRVIVQGSQDEPIVRAFIDRWVG